MTEQIKRERSAAHPGISLKEAIDAAIQLKTAFSSSPFSRESAAQALGYKGLSGPSTRKVAALVHYGLLDRMGTAYKPSDLTDRIALHTSEDERSHAIRDALTTPKLFGELIQEYDGKSLPTMLPNILARQHGISVKVAEEVATIFRESAAFAGVLVNGVISKRLGTDTESITGTEQPEPRPSFPTVIGASELAKSRTAAMGSAFQQAEYVVRLPSGIYIGYTENMAPLVAMGRFAKEIEALDKKVAQEMAGEQ